MEPNKFIEGVTNFFFGGINSQINGVVETVSGLGRQARDLGYEEAESGPLGKIIEFVADIGNKLRKALGNMFDKDGTAAEDAMRVSFNAAEGIFTNIDSALGIESAESTKNIVKAAMDKFLETGVPPIDGETGQRNTRKAILELRGELVTHFVDKLSAKYPNMSEEAITAAADRIAGEITGYRVLPDISDETILLNRIGDPAAGSIGDLFMKGQQRGRGEDRASVQVPALSISTAALSRIRTEASTPPEPDAQLIQQVQAWITANNAKGDARIVIDASKVIHTDNDRTKATATEIATALVASNVNLENLDAAIATLARPAAHNTTQR